MARVSGSAVFHAPAPVPVLALALLVSACDAGDRVTTGGAPLADSARSAIVSTDFDAPVRLDDWIGVDVPPSAMPPGVEHLSGSIWGEGDAPMALAEWRIDHVRVGGRPMLWAMSVTRRVEEPILNEDGVRIGTSSMPHFRVRDAVILPPYGRDDLVETYRCRTTDGERASALGQRGDEPGRIGNVRAAWTLDRAEGRLREADPATIRC